MEVKTKTGCRWWAYRHHSGTIHAKRYFETWDMLEALDSHFVAEVRGPIEGTREDALALFGAAKEKPYPLPWEILKMDNGDIFIVTTKADGLSNICEMNMGLSPQANADFILNAVSCHAELLAALKGLLGCDLHQNLIGGYQLQIEEAEEAISKAETK